MESYEEFLVTLVRIGMQREHCLLELLKDAQNKIRELEERQNESDAKGNV